MPQYTDEHSCRFGVVQSISQSGGQHTPIRTGSVFTPAFPSPSASLMSMMISRYVTPRKANAHEQTTTWRLSAACAMAKDAKTKCNNLIV
eukprot:scaffold36193_cov49-Prasinocladus_malaysianus.AAC.1